MPERSPKCLQDCCGHAPAYGEGARETLTETLYALRHMFHEAMGPLHDARSGQDLLPGLLQGKTFSQQLLDFSGFHTAVLWLGPSVVAAGEHQPCAVTMTSSANSGLRSQHSSEYTWIVLDTQHAVPVEV